MAACEGDHVVFDTHRLCLHEHNHTGYWGGMRKHTCMFTCAAQTVLCPQSISCQLLFKTKKSLNSLIPAA